MRRKKLLLGAVGLCAVMGAPVFAGDKPAVSVRAAESVELIPVIVVLKEQAPAFDVDMLRDFPSKAERRQFVIETLKHVANTTQGGILAELSAAQTAGKAANIRPLWLSNAIAVHVTADVEAMLAVRADVDHVHRESIVGEEVFPVIRDEVEVDEGGVVAAIECGVALMRAPQVWSDFGITGTGVVVGVIDTGTCLSHPDIANQLWLNPCEIPNNGIDDCGNGYIDDVYGWNFENNNNNVHDFNSHGSHVAGTVAGDGTQGTQCGMAPGAKIMTLKFWNNLGGEASVWQCMEYGLDNGADVLTASLGWLHAWNPARATWRQICENAFTTGTVVVFAAGNEGSSYGISSVRTPGDVPDMITVGATDCNMNIAGFSSRGPTTWQNVPPYFDWPHPPGKLKPTISAPGVSTISHYLCSGYTSYSGTSMATPHVAGAIALMLEANPNLDHYQVKQLLKDTAIDRGPQGPDNTYGHGFVDAYFAVEAAMATGCGRTDINGDTRVNSADVLEFLNLYNAGDPQADWNGDGVINSLDVLDFLADWIRCRS